MNVVTTGKVVGVAVLAAECRAVRAIEKCSVCSEVFAPSQGSIGSALRGRAYFSGRGRGAPVRPRNSLGTGVCGGDAVSADSELTLARSQPMECAGGRRLRGEHSAPPSASVARHLRGAATRYRYRWSRSQEPVTSRGRRSSLLPRQDGLQPSPLILGQRVSMHADF